jgi:hypothetical protein
MDWQTVATLVVSLALPVLIQVLRRLFDGEGKVLKDWRAQVLVFVVSVACAAGIGAVSGELKWNGDLLEVAMTMFAIASFVYKLFQDKLDELLRKE